MVKYRLCRVGSRGSRIDSAVARLSLGTVFIGGTLVFVTYWVSKPPTTVLDCSTCTKCAHISRSVRSRERAVSREMTI